MSTVTGGDGFIGGNIVRGLDARGIKITWWHMV
jgi:nucleoside-diphosphate-sugar epimerase